jgi:hypothetical protein
LPKTGGKIIIEIPDYKSISAKNSKSYWQGWHSPRHLSLLTNKGFPFVSKDKWEITTFAIRNP